jgi:hypothetical protein
MSTKNSYPNLPEIPVKKTSVDMPIVVAYAKTLVGKYLKEVVRTAYCIFRNESGNGKSGVNNNYGGIQADCGVWEGLDPTNINGTCVMKDNAGDVRRFICFNEKGYQACFDFLCYKINQRGMYIGSSLIPISKPTFEELEDEEKKVAVDNLYNAYQKKWVANAKEDTAEARDNFKSLYHSSLTAIVTEVH